MFGRMLCIGIGLSIVVFAPAALAQSASDAAQSFAHGQALLAKGEFGAAARAFAAAATAKPKNAEYRDQAALAARVVNLRERIKSERMVEKWEIMARSLRAFYYEHKLYAEALPLDRELHVKLSNAESATLLAQTELELGMNADAASLLGGLDAAAVTPLTRVLRGLALARQGQVEPARTIADGIKLPEKADADLLFLASELYALTGKPTEALQTLTLSLEQTPPSRLAAAKENVRSSKYFKALAAPDFARVLDTKSKVTESECSTGSACDKCPSRTKCAEEDKGKEGQPAKAKDQPEKPAKEGGK